MHCRLYQDVNLFPREHLKPQLLLERKWNSIKTKHGFPEEVKLTALKLLSQAKWGGTTAEAALAGSLYVAAHVTFEGVTQGELAEEFGVTEVTVRNAVNIIRRDLRT